MLFIGGTDWTALGRRPTEGDVLCPKRLLSFPKKIKLVASGPTACHSVCIDVDGGVSFRVGGVVVFVIVRVAVVVVVVVVFVVVDVVIVFFLLLWLPLLVSAPQFPFVVDVPPAAVADGIAYMALLSPPPLPMLRIRILPFLDFYLFFVQVYTWGRNEYGGLGHGDTAPRAHPTLVAALSGTRMKQASCGKSHTAILAEDGAFFISFFF